MGGMLAPELSGRMLIWASHLICVIHVTNMNKKDYDLSYHHMEITRLNKYSFVFPSALGEKNDLLGQKDSEMKKGVGVKHEQMGRA